MISIIIPVYNCEKYIGDLFKSIANQICKDFEVVIVDDGSTDNSFSIINEFFNSDKGRNIVHKVISQPNKGVSAARNAGLASTKGEYVVFVDADDLLDEDYLELLYNTISINNSDAVYCKINLFGHVERKFKFRGENVVVQVERDKVLYNLLFKSNIPIPTILFKKSIITENKISFPEGIAFAEDMEFKWKYFCHCRNLVELRKGLYNYRKYPDSSAARINEKRLQSIIVTQRICEYIRQHDSSFYPIFKKYGTAKRVLISSMYLAPSLSLREFYKLATKLNIKEHLRNLFSYPDFRIKTLSLVGSISITLLYYTFIIFKRICKLSNNKKYLGHYWL